MQDRLAAAERSLAETAQKLTAQQEVGLESILVEDCVQQQIPD